MAVNPIATGYGPSVTRTQRILFDGDERNFTLTIQDLSGGVRVYTIQVLYFSLVKGDNDVNPKLFIVYFTMMNYFISVPYKCILFIV